MPTRDTLPVGAPCWADLWTSDVEGARRFYGELFGWDAEDPQPEFGGYFSFLRDGRRIAGCMGDMGDMKANDAWKIYLTTDDATKVVERAAEAGAEIFAPAMPVAELGVQVVMADPTGAAVGAWQPGTHPGFTVLGEHGAPSWFELHTRDHARAVAFYASVFGLDATALPGDHAIAYTTFRNPGGDADLGGIADASALLPDGVASHWLVYWHVDDIAGAVENVTRLGGSIVHGPDVTPHGHLAAVADPAGARFQLRTPNDA